MIYEAGDEGNSTNGIISDEAFEQMIKHSANPVPHGMMYAELYNYERMEAFLNTSGRVIDFTGNNPNWRGNRNSFRPYIKALREGSEIPEEATEGIGEDCNKAIEEGYVNSQLHE